MLGILCATPEELIALKARLAVGDEPEVHGPTQVWRGRHRGSAMVLAQAGIGKVNAAAAATLLLSLFEVETLIFAGVAGGLDPSLSVGSVLLADALSIHDYGVMAAGRLTSTESGLIPLGAPELTVLSAVPQQVASDLARLAEYLRPRIEASVRVGGILTADYFLNCAETRNDLHARFGAAAIDMESGAVAQVARAWGRPVYVIRTLSDLAGEESHLTYPQMAQMAAHNSALCIMALLDLLGDAP